jgi:chlorophyll synthase
MAVVSSRGGAAVRRARGLRTTKGKGRGGSRGRVRSEQNTGENEEEVARTASNKQLLGIRGASKNQDLWRIRLQLTKPVTWIPLIWGVGCGAAASGNYQWNSPEDIAKLFSAMALSGPCLTGYTQTLNDFFDKDIDAINEPDRPIPSGAISEGQVTAQILLLLTFGVSIAYGLDVWVGHYPTPEVTLLALFGSLISLAYSAPPLKLKQNGFFGNYALGSSYIALPWLAGQAAFGNITPEVIGLTAFYSLAGFGIAIVNDFKAIDGDRESGINSIPVIFGMNASKYICALSIDLTQFAVAGYLYWLGEKTYAAVLFALVLPQAFFQVKYLIPDPVENDVKYQGASQPFLVFGLLAAGLAYGDHLNKLAAAAEAFGGAAVTSG